MTALAIATAGLTELRPARVLERRRETADVTTLTLAREDGGTDVLPGQFAMLYAFGAGEVPISYSGDPRRPERVHTLRAVGAVTRALGEAPVGTELGVRGPFGRGWPLDEAEGRHVVVLGGGIGLAPLRPVLYALAAGAPRAARVTVLHGARTPQNLLFEASLAAWREQAGFAVQTIVDRASTDWTGRVGVLPALLDRLEGPLEDALVFMCGPEVMLRYGVRSLIRRGVPPTAIHVSLERNMQCAVGSCGHCQLGGVFVCRDGPVFPWPEVASRLAVKEI